MSDDTCPHCNHLWDNHDGLLTGSKTCDVCGCMWQEPKPPQPEPPKPDLAIHHLEGLLWDAFEAVADGDGPACSCALESPEPQPRGAAVKCPECVRTGQLSKLYMPNGYTSTLMGGTQTYFDEDGVRHHHEVNTSRGQGSCSNGHILDFIASTKCPAPECDYGHPTKVTFVAPEPPKPEPEYVEFKNLTISFAPQGPPGPEAIVYKPNPEAKQ